MGTENMPKVPEWTVGDRVRKARESVGMDQQALADATGMSRRSITNYETGHSKPRWPQVLAIAAATGVDWDWIAAGDYLKAVVRGAHMPRVTASAMMSRSAVAA